MSTVPEAIYARLRGMRVFGLSGITNMGTGLSVERHSHETVKQQADLLAPRATRLLKRFLVTFESVAGE
jgi:purine-nucleoside phosphorylase